MWSSCFKVTEIENPSDDNGPRVGGIQVNCCVVQMFENKGGSEHPRADGSSRDKEVEVIQVNCVV